MSEFTLSLKINTVGDKEALRALNDLDQKGRKIVEDAAASLGKSMGSVAVAYQRGGKEMQSALAAVAAGHREAITQAERQGVAAETLERRQGRATLQAARGMEQLVRSAQGTGSALDTIFAQVSQLAFGFGAAGPLVGAVAVAGLAIVEVFEATKREMKKAIDEAENEFKRLAKAGDRVAIRARIKEIVGGDRFGSSDEDVAGIEGARARRKQLEAQRAALLKLHPEHQAATGVVVGAIARAIGDPVAGAIARASDELRDLDGFLQKVTPEVVQLRGRLKELNDENAGKDAAKGFEEWFKQQERLIKGLSLAGELTAGRIGQLADEAKAWRAIASTLDVTNPMYERYLVLAKSAADLANKSEGGAWGRLGGIASRAAVVLPKLDPGAASREARAGILASFMPTKEQQDALAFEVKQAVDNSLAALANDPILLKGKHLKQIADQLGEAIRGSLATAFEAGFDGGGVTGFFKSVTGTILTAFGTMMEEVGASFLAFGTIMEAIVVWLNDPLTAGPAAIAASVALIALGAATKAAGARLTGSGGGGGGGSVGSSMATPSFLTFAVQRSALPTTSQQAPSAKGNNYFTIIGPADPKAQRAIADIVNAGSDRNLIRRGA